MEAPPTPNPARDARPSEITTPTKPPQKAERLIDTKSIGLEVVYNPPTAPGSKVAGVDVDVIAIHGLGADPDWSWKDKASGVSWIRDSHMLPSAIPNARILRFGYDAKWWGEGSVRARIPDLAIKLLRGIMNEPERKKHPQRPLIFICHCFGGLVVEQALCTAKLNKGRYPDVFKACKGLVLMGTPHRGTGDFTSEALVLRIINAEIPVQLTAIDVLKPKNETLVSLVDDFTQILMDRKVRDSLQIFCFFEEKSTTASDVLKNVVTSGELDRSVVKEFVVDRESAKLEGYEFEGLGLNHFQLNKFSRPEDGYYKRVKEVIVNMIEKALLPSDTLKKPARMPSVRQNGSYRSATSMPPYEKDRYFQGREKILEQITSKLAKPHRHRAVLLGPPGIGKTHVAIQFAYSYGEKLPPRRVFWLTARTFNEFQRAYIKLGTSLSVPGLTDNEDHPLSLIKSFLGEETQGYWLMVLDGVDDLESKDLERLNNCLPSSPLGAILVTTCKQPVAKVLALKQSEDILDDIFPFTKNEAFPLFRKELTQKRVSDDEVCDLVTQLEGLPLAIVQAAAYLTNCPNVTAQDYLQELSACDPKTTNTGILATTQISFNHICGTTRSVADLARTASMFDFQTIPLQMLRYYNSKVEEFCALMKGFAMIDILTDGLEVSLHRLIRSSIKATATELESLTDTMSENFPSLDLGKVALLQIQKCAILLPYAESVLRLEPKPATNDGKRHRASLLFKTGKYHAYRKKYDPAIERLKESLQLREKEVPQDPKLIEEATTILRDVKKLAKSPDRLSSHPKDQLSLGIDDCVAHARKRLNSKQHNEVESKLIQYSQAHDAGSMITNIDTKRAEDALAILYDNKGQHDKAIERHEVVHKWCLQNYGPQNLETSRQVYKIARNLDLRGKYAEAEAKYREAWDGTKTCLGENHPEASRILCSLATVYSKQGKRLEAKTSFEEALRLQEQDPGPQHEDTLTTKHNYALFLESENTQDSAKRAGELLGRVLQQQEAILSSGHPDTLRTASNLAHNFSVRGMDEKALELCRLVYPRQVERLGAEHPNTAATKMLMARIQ